MTATSLVTHLLPRILAAGPPRPVVSVRRHADVDATNGRSRADRDVEHHVAVQPTPRPGADPAAVVQGRSSLVPVTLPRVGGVGPCHAPLDERGEAVFVDLLRPTAGRRRDV